MRFDFLTVEPGRVVFAYELDESAYNPIGVIHGGLVCTLLDSVTGCALHSTLPAGKGYTTVEIQVNYLRAVRLSSGRLTAIGAVVKAGSRIGFAEGVVTDSSGALVATASSTIITFDTNDASRQHIPKNRSMMQPKILVIGATGRHGNTGAIVVDRLISQGRDVRVLTRTDGAMVVVDARITAFTAISAPKKPEWSRVNSSRVKRTNCLRYRLEESSMVRQRNEGLE